MIGRQPLATYPSPLRYPGGKRKVANFLKLLLLENDLVGRSYLEPYAGGAAVALSLLYEEYVDTIHINDLDRAVHAFWRAAIDQTDEMTALILGTPLTMDEWYRQRDVQDAEDPDPLELGFSTLYLNRTNRSGIIRGGVIGGYDQTGEWGLDARFERDQLVAKVRKVGRYANRITLTCADAVDLLTQPADVGKWFYFLDPPYYVKGQGLYQNAYQHDDHARIAEVVAGLEVPWVLSYDAAPAILELHANHPSLRYSLSYSASQRYQGNEVMFFSDGIEIPEVSTPNCVPSTVIDDAKLASLGG